MRRSTGRKCSEIPHEDKEATTSRPGMQQNRLFAGPFLSRLPKSYTGATAVLVDELDTGGFQGTASGQEPPRHANFAVGAR
jgi:hypothetical protein